MTIWLTEDELTEISTVALSCPGPAAEATHAMVAELRARRAIDADVNAAINRAGIHYAVTYAEAIVSIASARDEARSRVAALEHELSQALEAAEDNARRAAPAVNGTIAELEQLIQTIDGRTIFLMAADLDALRWLRAHGEIVMAYRVGAPEGETDPDGNELPGEWAPTRGAEAIAVLDKLLARSGS